MTSPPGDRHVAFFRNMNLGQQRSKSPTSRVLVEAFTTAGATGVTSFQTNGTVIFDAIDTEIVIPVARQVLLDATGYADAVVVRTATWVVALGQRLDPLLPAAEVAMFDAHDDPALPLPWTDTGGNLTIVELDSRHAVTSWVSHGAGSGSNPTLTRMLGVPVTCRGVPTMLRLAARLAVEDPKRQTGRNSS